MSVVTAVIIQAVLIAFWGTAALSHRKPYSAGIPRDINCDGAHDNRNVCTTLHSLSTTILPIPPTPSSEGRSVPHRVCDKNGIQFCNKYFVTRNANWFGNILHRNCLLKHVIEGKGEGGIQVTGRQRRGRMHLLENLQEKRAYWIYEEATLDCTVRTGFGRGYGPVRETEE